MKRTIMVFALVLATATAAWAQTRFPDVPSDHSYAEDIIYAVDQGWFAGYPDGTFRPDAKLTASHASRVFHRVIPSAGISRGAFARFLRGGVERLREVVDESCLTWDLEARTEGFTTETMCLLTEEKVMREGRVYVLARFQTRTDCPRGLIIEARLAINGVGIRNSVTQGNTPTALAGDTLALQIPLTLDRWDDIIITALECQQ